VSEIHEPVLVQTFIAEVEALDERVLRGLAAIDEVQRHLVLIRPLIHDAAGEFRSVVYLDRGWHRVMPGFFHAPDGMTVGEASGMASEFTFRKPSCRIAKSPSTPSRPHLINRSTTLDALKTYTSTPDIYSTYGEAHSTGALPRLAVRVLIALCAVKLLLHLFTSVRHYGYFRDELYYLDMARHLDWGYVDAAPLIAVYSKGAMLLGGSLAALRILPALAGTALVALTVLIARELGGGRYAQLLAGVAVCSVPPF